MNKRIATILSFVAMLYFSGTVMAQQAAPQVMFDNANKLYQQKKYSEAAASYQRLLDEGYTLPLLYLNAGNAYYRSNQNGMAVYNFEKVLLADPDNNAARHNLSLANQRVDGYISPLPLLFFQRWWLQWQQMHSVNGWAIGAIIWCWIFVAGLGCYWFTDRFKKQRGLKWALYITGVLFGIYFLMSIGTYTYTQQHNKGIIIAESVKMKMAPDQNSKELQDIKGGMKVEILDATTEYCKIELADGKTGWISCQYIKRL